MGKTKAKRQKIPAGLVSEIREYSALLRTLSVGTTSDLTGQLLRHEQELRFDKDSWDGETEDDEAMYSRPPSPDTSSLPPPTSPLPTSSQFTGSPSRSSSSLPLVSGSPLTPSRKRKLSAPTPSSPRKRRTMMNFARWPLLLEDVPKPEWELQDEVAAMISQLQLDDPEEQEEEEEEQDCVPAVTLSTAHFLESLLATIAGYTPRRADSLQDRLNPIDWRYVLRATTNQEFVDPEAVRKAERRLQAIYGGEGVPIPSTSSNGRRTKQEDILNEILYLPEGPPRPEPEVRVVKRRNKPEGAPRRKYEWKDGRKLKRDLVAAAKAKKKSEREGLGG
ncbi:hypothetical protein CPB85DRAFT_1444033 [Mucidula mucida]|nr:hypothetical protein CPB85DRAFT_1444033 [Mucidula mucida]